MLKQKIENVITGQQVEKVREHVRANKNAYIAAGIGVLVGRLTAPRAVGVRIVNQVVTPSQEIQGL